MKATLVSYGTLGDCAPLVALGLRLREAGHEVVLVGEGRCHALADRHGLEFHTLAGDIVELLQPGGAHAVTVEVGRVTLRSLDTRWRDDQAWVRTIHQAAAGSDVVVGLPIATYHTLSVAADIGAIPVIGELQPMAPTRDFKPSSIGKSTRAGWINRLVGHYIAAVGWATSQSPLNEARRALGLPRAKEPGPDIRRLGAWSPTLVPRPNDWPVGATVTGAWRLPSAVWEPSPELSDFIRDGEPPVYVGFGSMPTFSKMGALLEALRQGLAGRRVVLGAGATRDWPEPRSPDVFFAGQVPHEWLFPRCAAVVHHCGAGTTHAALLAGTPTIPVPILLDQPFWAERLGRLGVATAPIDPRRADARAVRAALAAVATMGKRAHDVAQQVQAEDGTGEAVAALEELVGSGSGAR
ncbi:MAG: glycosyltransferase [Propionibacteriaceae bacterium]|nr:glycosyltransferase [Propionibacteriaceae bacterium]